MGEMGYGRETRVEGRKERGKRNKEGGRIERRDGKEREMREKIYTW